MTAAARVPQLFCSGGGAGGETVAQVIQILGSHGLGRARLAACYDFLISVLLGSPEILFKILL